MKIILTALDKPLYDAWNKHCGDLPNVECYHGSILDVEADTFVSPANSFGFMDGGIDWAYTQKYGEQLEERLRMHINFGRDGELLVGQAALQRIGESNTFIIAAPTMRVPMILPADTINPYLAAKAALRIVVEHDFTAAFPGLGTGVGRVSPDNCARQMRYAIEEVVLGKRYVPASIAEAMIRHCEIAGVPYYNMQQPRQ